MEKFKIKSEYLFLAKSKKEQHLLSIVKNTTFTQKLSLVLNISPKTSRLLIRKHEQKSSIPGIHQNRSMSGTWP